ASRYSAIPPKRPSAGTMGSEPDTSGSIVFNPNANRTMPTTIGRWRYEYTSLASAARDAPVASASLAWAMNTTQSKYDHHRHAATVIPRSAAAITPASTGSAAAPTPIATIDSPSAMLVLKTNGSKRSAGDG